MRKCSISNKIKVSKNKQSRNPRKKRKKTSKIKIKSQRKTQIRRRKMVSLANSRTFLPDLIKNINNLIYS